MTHEEPIHAAAGDHVAAGAGHARDVEVEQLGGVQLRGRAVDEAVVRVERHVHGAPHAAAHHRVARQAQRRCGAQHHVVVARVHHCEVHVADGGHGRQVVQLEVAEGDNDVADGARRALGRQSHVCRWKRKQGRRAADQMAMVCFTLKIDLYSFANVSCLSKRGQGTASRLPVRRKSGVTSNQLMIVVRARRG